MRLLERYLMQKAKIPFVAVLLAGTSLSVSARAMQVEQSQHEIVGGEVVSDLSSFEYKHTVRLLVKGVLDGKNIPDSIKGLKMTWRCSGALLSKTVVLSAAHCFPRSIGIKDPETGEIVRGEMTGLSAEAFFKTDTRADRPWGVKSQKIIIHEEFRDDWVSRVGNVWNPSESIHDIALVKLSEEASTDKAPVGLLSKQEVQLSSGEDAVLAGYGRDLSDDQVAIPRLRKVSVPMREALRNATEWYVGRGDLLKAGKVDRPGGGCVGDSGGPVFVKRSGGVRLAGVIVRGPDEQNGGCQASVTIVTAIPAYSSWISQRMAELARP